MDSVPYFELVFNNWELFIISNLLTFLVFYLAYKRYFISVLDPFSFAIFFSAMAVTVPTFLYMVNQISDKLYLSFLLTQFSFFIGFNLVKPLKVYVKNNLKFNAGEIRFAKWLFIVVGCLQIILQLLSYKNFGIPVFSESRLALYGESGGINNLIKRVLDINFKCYIFLTIYFFNYKNKKKGFRIFTRLSVFLILVFSILSGSKGAFLTFGNAFFIYSLYALRWGDSSSYLLIKKFILKFGFFAMLSAITVILLSEKDANPFYFLLFRIAQSGDVYYMAYPNEVIDKVPQVNWFIALFSSPLSLTGIIPRSMVPGPIGFFLMNYHNPLVEFRGPNPRMNVFSYIYFGLVYSPLYCLIIGIVASFIRNRLYSILPQNIIGCLIYFLMLGFALNLEPDFQNGLADFINILTITPILFIIAYSLSKRNIIETYV